MKKTRKEINKGKEDIKERTIKEKRRNNTRSETRKEWKH